MSLGEDLAASLADWARTGYESAYFTADLGPRSAAAPLPALPPAAGGRRPFEGDSATTSWRSPGRRHLRAVVSS